jgi:hemerythrin-like metal-binding protein/diguanylate cyclase (GGDEF)-like protein
MTDNKLIYSAVHEHMNHSAELLQRLARDVAAWPADSPATGHLAELHCSHAALNLALHEMERLAGEDALTGAWNRRRLEEAMLNEMNRQRLYDHPASLVAIEIDGPVPADQVLLEFATLVAASLRATDSLTRWDTHKFVVLCPNTSHDKAQHLAEQLRKRVAQAGFSNEQTLFVSMGVAECVLGDTWPQWLAHANQALMSAQDHGGNQVHAAAAPAGVVVEGEKVSAHFVKLTWHAAYESGNPVIDTQHKGLFDDANQLMAAILCARPTDELTELVDQLINDIVTHFQDEEAIILAAGYPGAAQHATIHRALLNGAADVANRFHAGSLAVGELFQYLAHDVVARHMLGSDREFFRYLKNKSEFAT